MRNPITGNASNATYTAFANRVLDPDVYTGIFYENNDYQKKRRETCQTWNTEDFRSDNPVTGRAVIFEMFHAILDLRRLAYERILQPVSPDEELQPVTPDDVAYRSLLRSSSEKLFQLYHELIETSTSAISPDRYELFKQFVREVEGDAEQFEKDLRNGKRWPSKRYDTMITLQNVVRARTIRECVEFLHAPPLRVFDRNPFAPALAMLEEMRQVKRARLEGPSV